MESMDFETVEEDVCVPMDVDAVPEYVILSQIKSIRKLRADPPPSMTSQPPFCPPLSNVSVEAKRDHLFIVLDTNVLLGHLNFITEVRDGMVCDLRPTLLLPWIVIQELDGLKENEMVGRQANKAVKFIHACVSDRHPRVRVQRSDEETSEKRLKIECNDDRILECCLYFRSGVDHGGVVLFTNDVNLSVKSMVHNILAFSRETIVNGLKQWRHKGNEIQRTSKMTPLATDPDVYESAAKRPCQQVSRETPPSSNKAHNTQHGTSRDHYRFGVKRKRPHGLSQATPTKEKPNQQIKVSNKRDSSIPTTSSDDSVYCRASSVLRDSLAYCIEEHMVKIYEELWMTIVAVKPPWTLRDCLFLLSKHWVAVFGFVLPRDTKKFVEILQDLVKRAESKILSDVQAKCFVETSREVIKMFTNEASHPEKIRDFDKKLGLLL